MEVRILEGAAVILVGLVAVRFIVRELASILDEMRNMPSRRKDTDDRRK